MPPTYLLRYYLSPTILQLTYLFISHPPINPHTYIIETYLLYLYTYLPTYLCTHQLFFYITYSFTSFTYLHTYLLLPIIQPIYLSTSSTYIHTSYLPSYNLSNYLFPLPTYLPPTSYFLQPICLLVIDYLSFLLTYISGVQHLI
jgi:hypothetical protein